MRSFFRSLSLLVMTGSALLVSSGLSGQATDEPSDPNVVIHPSFLSGLKYRNVGPYRGGRVTAVTGVPGRLHLFYFGSTGGGVWKSEDAGESWTNLTDGQLEVGSVGAIAVAPSDPNVIYVGTGSACIRGNVSPGIGVYRSTDAGQTWKHIGLDEVGQIGRIRVHPSDPDFVYVAVLGNVFGPGDQRGVFRSKNGGENWEKVLYIDDRTGVVDLSMDPSNPRVLYAATWNGERKPWTLISGSDRCGVFKTTDGGNTWKKLGGGLPEGVVGRIGMAVSPSKPDRIWALVEAEEGGLYRSDDAGTTWKKISDQSGLRERSWYYMHVTADPKDENTVWVSNVMLYKSIDGGKSFEMVGTAHGDNHDLWIHPDDTRIMINGDDGGAAVTLNGGKTWSSLRNQPTAEIYRITVDDRFPYRLYGAQQDNTTVSVPSRLPPNMISDTEAEYQVGGCESGHIAVDPRDPDIVYAGCYGGSITRMNLRSGQVREVIVYPQLQLGQLRSDLRYRFQWNAPIRISMHDPKVLYHTSQVVHRSTDGGQSWEEISPDLTTDDPEHQDYAGGPISRDGTGVEVYGTVFAFEESPHEAGVLWAGSDDGRLHVSRNAGGDWQEVTPGDLPQGSTINSIDVSAHDPARLLVSAYRYRESDFRPYVFRTNDFGQSWTSLTTSGNGIADDHFVRVVREDPDRKGLLYAGTEFGIYVSFDDGAHWQSLQLNLPVTPVTDIKVHHKDLVLATQGRSFWILDDVTPLHQLTDEVTSAKAHLFEPRQTPRALSGGFSPGGPSGRRAANPPNGAILYYSLRERPDSPITIEILDPAGNSVQSFSSEKKPAPDLGALAALAEFFGFSPIPSPLPAEPGLQRYVWNLRYAAPKMPKGAVIFGIVQGPVAPPGTYQVKMSIGEWSQTQELEVVADPRVDVVQEELEAQFRFLRDVGTVITNLADRLEALRSARDQVRLAASRAQKAGVAEEKLEQVKKAADSIAEHLGSIEDELVQTKSRGFEDPLNYPGKLYAQLAYLHGVVNGEFGSVDAPPTEGAKERLADLTEEVNEVFGRLEDLLSTEVASFNQLMDGLNLPSVIVEETGGNQADGK